MKKLFLLLFSVLAFTSQVRADVEWTIWEGSITKDNVQGKSKLDFSTLEVGDMICVYGTGTLSKAISRVSGSNWGTWTSIQDYAPAVDATYGYYHVVTPEFLTNFNYSDDDTKTWAVQNWDDGTITKVTIKKAKSAIRTTLSSVTKEADEFEYTIEKENLSNMVEGDFIRLSTSQRSKVGETDYKIEFKQADGDWPTYTTMEPTHDAIWKIDNTAITGGIKDHSLWIHGQLYNSYGVYLYHPVNSFKIGSIGMATFSADQEVTVPDGLTAYKATISGDNVSLTPFNNNVIPANTGAIIAGGEGSVLEFVASSTESTEASELIACTTATNVSSLEQSGFDLYVLYNNPTGGNTPLDLTNLNCGWESAYNSGTKTITFDDEWKGRGWGWNFDYSDYSKVVVEFESAAKSGHLSVEYNVGNTTTTEFADYVQGATSVEINLNASLKSNIKQIYLSASEASTLTLTNAYLVSNSGSQKAEFRKTTSGTLAANKAYLKLLSSSPARLSIVFNDEDSETTGVLDVQKHTTQSDNVYYNLRGMQVDKPTKGLYIMNGKKVFVK